MDPSKRPAPWQVAVIDLVAGRHVGPGGGLSPREEAWLDQVSAAPDHERSRTARTSWRIERLTRATPLTLLLLRQLGCEHRVVEAYVVATAAPSPQLIPEGLQFLAFVERVATREPHLFEILELERQALLARAVPWTAPPEARRATGWLDRSSSGAAIEVEAEPQELLVAVVTGRPLPRLGSGSGTLLVGPGVDRKFRVADVAERRVLREVPGPRPYVEVVTTAAAADAVERLVAAGVLEHRPDAVPAGTAGTDRRAPSTPGDGGAT